jgi:dienelactone hydrolase
MSFSKSSTSRERGGARFMHFSRGARKGKGKRGRPAEIVIYEGAVHSFDAPNMTLRERLAPLTAAGEALLQGTGHAAREDALRRVPAVLERSLKPE